MNKNWGILALLIILFASQTAVADPVAPGDLIKLGDGPGANGGEFYADVAPFGGTDFITFCLQTTEVIQLGTTYVVNDISGIVEDHTGNVPLDTKTAYLYYLFRTDQLTGYTHTTLSANALQRLIWVSQGQTVGSNIVGGYDAALYANWAALIVPPGFDPSVVKALNLRTLAGGYAQDVLAYFPVSVPEPGTIILLGSGLIGLFAFGRRLGK